MGGNLPVKLAWLASDLGNYQFQHLALEIVMTRHLIKQE